MSWNMEIVLKPISFLTTTNYIKYKMHQDNFVCHCYPHIPWKVYNLWLYLICCDNQRYGILIITSKYSFQMDFMWISMPKTKSSLNIIWFGQLCCFIRITLNWSKSIAWLMTTCLQPGSICSFNYWYSLPALHSPAEL